MLNFFPLLLVVSSLPVQPVIVKTAELEITLMPRTPNQMASFYEARGFPAEMIDILRQQCFITVGIQNNSAEKIWLDMDSWLFTTAGKTLTRKNRELWSQTWQQLDMPMNKQSTFRWTLIPETLDYLPAEREGGNVVLEFSDGMISLNATFASGDDKQGKKIFITTDKLFCAEDPR